MKTCILIRGIPGSGKSSFAKFIQNIDKNNSFDHWEADAYYYQKYGEYKWSKEEAPIAHEWCFNNFKDSLKKGKNVIVSNTFIHKWEMERYIIEAMKNNYKITILKMQNSFNTIHNVPADTIERMKNEFEE